MTPEAGAPRITYTVEDGVGVLTLNSPPANVMDGGFFRELAALTCEVIPSSGARGIVIVPKGRHFSSGADLGWLGATVRAAMDCREGGEIPAILKENRKSFEFFQSPERVSVAAMRGVCLGSGLELALACRVRIAAEGAVMGLPESTFGIMPGCGGSALLTRLTGKARAMELCLTGRTFTAREALEWGIVDEVVPPGEVSERALRFCAERLRGR